ncbi:MAG: GNAT family N-acetyltransferase [Woeseiaceae bacterium]
MEHGGIIENGWALAVPDEADIDELMRWLPDATSVDRWSGPRFRFPFTRESFREDCRVDEIATYCVRNPNGVMAAFGQMYERDDRGHLARLITHPEMRRQGIGQRLIRMIMTAARQEWGHEQSSLFVYRDNDAAYRCYLKMGFVLQDYPDGAPMQDECYFLTRENVFAEG